MFLVILATATGWSVGSEYIWAATLFGFSAGMQLARLLEDLFYYRVKRKAEQR